MKNLFILLLTVFALSCTSDNDFKKGKINLENQGYTNIVNTGHQYFCCSKDEQFSTGFKAIDKQGRKIEGCFCSTMLKGLTVRFE